MSFLTRPKSGLELNHLHDNDPSLMREEINLSPSLFLLSNSLDSKYWCINESDQVEQDEGHYLPSVEPRTKENITKIQRSIQFDSGT